MADMKRAFSVLAWLWVLLEHCQANPCAGVANANVENPDDPDCKSYIRDLIAEREREGLWLYE